MYIGKLEELIELLKVAYCIFRVQLKLKPFLEFNPEKEKIQILKRNKSVCFDINNISLQRILKFINIAFICYLI